MAVFIPAVAQKRFMAKGRSREMHSTSVFFSFAACSLNFRTDMAHTDVSRLGNMLRTNHFPLCSLESNSVKSVFVSLKSGILSPAISILPSSITLIPLNFVSILLLDFCLLMICKQSVE